MFWIQIRNKFQRIKAGLGFVAIGIFMLVALFLNLLVSTPTAPKSEKQFMIQSDDILNTLDISFDIERTWRLVPMFDAEGYYPAGFRLSVFIDIKTDAWVIAIEDFCWWDNTSSIERTLYLYGNVLQEQGGRNCEQEGSKQIADLLLREQPNYQPGIFKYPEHPKESWKLIADYRHWTFQWDGKNYTFDLERTDYEKVGIILEAREPGPGSLQPWELTRYLYAYFAESVFAPDDELLSIIDTARSDNIPPLATRLRLFYRTLKWEHPDLVNEQKPSEMTFFPLLAEAISKQDVSVMKRFDLRKANTTWQYWADKKRVSDEAFYGQVEPDATLPPGEFRKVITDPPNRSDHD